MTGGWVPALTVAVAWLVCKGLLYATVLLAGAGIAVDIPLGPWAVAVDIAVLAVVAALWFARRRHRIIWPVVLAAVGAALVIGRMHGPVTDTLEWAGLLLLVIAAYYDWNARRRRGENA